MPETRAQRLKRKFGITVTQYNAMAKAQGGRCKLCGRKPAKNRLAVDHCHRIERLEGRIVIRGLLCWICNRFIIGMIERWGADPAKIVEYLKDSN